MLLAAIEDHGPRNWKAIATCIPNRNHAQCLQRWVKALQPGLKKGYWSRHEDDLLRELVFQGGWITGKRTRWSAMSKKIVGRTPKQCRERWHHHLSPFINRDPYTEEEDVLILTQHKLVGNKWADISRMLTGRTSEAVKTRWQTLQKREQRKQNVPAASSTSSHQTSCSLVSRASLRFSNPHLTEVQEAVEVEAQNQANIENKDPFGSETVVPATSVCIKAEPMSNIINKFPLVCEPVMPATAVCIKAEPSQSSNQSDVKQVAAHMPSPPCDWNTSKGCSSSPMNDGSVDPTAEPASVSDCDSSAANELVDKADLGWLADLVEEYFGEQRTAVKKTEQAHRAILRENETDNPRIVFHDDRDLDMPGLEELADVPLSPFP